MQEKDNIKNLAGESLRNFEVQPPSGLWDRIESGLARRRRKILIFRYSSIAASLLLLIGLGIGYLNYNSGIDTPEKLIAGKTENKKSDNKETGKQSTTTGNAASSDKKLDDNKSKADDGNGTVSGKTPVDKATPGNTGKTNSSPSNIKKSLPAKPAKAKDMPVRNQTNLMAQTEDQQNNLNINATQTDNAKSTAEVEPQPQEMMPAVILPQNITPAADLALVIPDNNAPVTDNGANSSWSLAVGYGFTSGADFTGDADALNDGGRGYSHDDFTASIANETSYFEEVDNTIHDAPLSVGFTVDKQLTKRLSFETGLMYTRLKYRVKTNELDPFYREYRNELNYLGIPAGIRYSFVQKKKYDLYALQWAVLEKGVSGVWYTDTYNNNVIESSESNREKIRGIQLSSVTGLGAQYKLAAQFYLFGQGGIQVFYLNKTQPYNLRSTKTVWPSIQAGIRMKLD